MQIGNKIKKVRELKNLTQEHMAEKLGMNQSNYSRYETESNDITLGLLGKISEIFEMKLEELLNFDEKCFFYNYANAKNFGINHINESEKEKAHEREIENLLKTIKLLEEKIEFIEKLSVGNKNG